MKKFFMFAAMASVALASCTKNEPAASVEQGSLITFEAPVVAPATKAQVKYEGNFSVYAWYHTGDYVGDGVAESIYMDDVPVTLTDGVYSNAGYYWPKKGKLSFFAYSPTQPNGTLVMSTMTPVGNIEMTYTVSDDIAEKDDLLYSDWSKDQTIEDYVSLSAALGSYEGVQIAFHHALSALQFNVQTTAAGNEKFQIHSITINNAYNKNTLTCTPTSAAWDADGHEGDGTYVVLTGDNTVLTSAKKALLNEFNVLPQELGVGVTLDITYSIKNPSSGAWIPQTESLSLKDAQDEWVMGKKYIYTLVFDVDVIQFAPVIAENWDEVTVGDIEQ